jgi:hypothetical protein
MRAPGVSRLRKHHPGVVDAVHVSTDAAAQLRDRQAGAEPDLENPVTGLHPEKRNHPGVALPFRPGLVCLLSYYLTH